MDWNKRLQDLSDRDFDKRYKVSKETFAELVAKLRPYVGTAIDHAFAKRSSGSGIPTELCLSMTMRWLCGGNVYDIVDLHRVHKSKFYHILWCTVAAINVICEHLHICVNVRAAYSKHGRATRQAKKRKLHRMQWSVPCNHFPTVFIFTYMWWECWQHT